MQVIHNPPLCAFWCLLLCSLLPENRDWTVIEMVLCQGWGRTGPIFTGLLLFNAGGSGPWVPMLSSLNEDCVNKDRLRFIQLAPFPGVLESVLPALSLCLPS